MAAVQPCARAAGRADLPAVLPRGRQSPHLQGGCPGTPKQLAFPWLQQSVVHRIPHKPMRRLPGVTPLPVCMREGTSFI